MGGGIVTAAFIFQIPRFEMRAVVAGVNEDCILIKPFFLQLIHEPADIFIQAIDCRHIIGIHLIIVALQERQIGRDRIIPIPFNRLFGALVAVVIILMMRLKLGNKQEKRLIRSLLIQIFQRKIIDAVCTVALEVNLVPLCVKDIAVITVRGEFQHVGCAPPVPIATLPILWNRGFFTMDANIGKTVGGKMPFANISRLIPSLIEIFRKRLDLLRKRDPIPIAAALRRIQAGLQAGTRRSAHWLAGVRILKLNALLCELHQIGGYLLIDRVPALLVAEIKDNVRTHI